MVRSPMRIRTRRGTCPGPAENGREKDEEQDARHDRAPAAPIDGGTRIGPMKDGFRLIIGQTGRQVDGATQEHEHNAQNCREKARADPGQSTQAVL